jgi:hypothetical protein
MDERFQKAITFVLQMEGGYTDGSSGDLGGETKFGICKRAYPDLDIRNLTVERAKEIYRRDYWEKAGCDLLSWPLDLIVFDAAVNQGVSFAREMAHECRDAPAALMYRLKKYSAIVAGRPQSAKFFRGWVNRVLLLYDYVERNARV